MIRGLSWIWRGSAAALPIVVASLLACSQGSGSTVVPTSTSLPCVASGSCTLTEAAPARLVARLAAPLRSLLRLA